MHNNKVDFEGYDKSATVCYSTHASAYGAVVLLTTERGICGLHFLEQPLAYYLHLAEKKFSVAPVHTPLHTQNWWQRIQQATTTLPLVVYGTLFHKKVWQALCTIPAGTTCTYQALATQLGLAHGARAVANAVAHNFIAWLVPCHRVVRQDGHLGGYRWGVSRKIALLEDEKALLSLGCSAPAGVKQCEA